jgi:dUTP pyrophosphatase
VALIKKIHPDAIIPMKAHSTDSGYDLYSVENVILRPNEWKYISTGIALKPPAGFDFEIRPRSGLAVKYGITIINSPGTIDADYRGEVKIAVINLGKAEYTVNRGDRIAQMVIKKVCQAVIEQADKLNSTKRNSGGFGHTGV